MSHHASLNDFAQLASNGNIMLSPRLGEPSQLDSRSEHVNMCATYNVALAPVEFQNRHSHLTSKVEHAGLLALLDMVPDLDRNITRRHLCHPDPHKRHQPDLWVIRLDKDDRPRRNDREILLRIILAFT